MKNLNSILVIIMSLVVLFGSASISVSPHKTPEKNKTSDQTENQTETVEQNNTSDYIKDTSDMSDKCEQPQKQNEDTAQKGKTEDTSDTVNRIEEEKPEIKPEQPQNETASEIDESIEIAQSTEKTEITESLPQAEINEKATETSEPEPENQVDNNASAPSNPTETQQKIDIGKIISDFFKQDTPSNQSLEVSSENTVSDYEEEVVELVNEIRKEYDLSPLKLNTELSAVARTKSADMREKGYFSHTSPTYGSPFDMMKSFGIKYKTAGENIAMGYKTPQAVVDGWMNSKGHRANILNSSFTEIGVGYVENGNYWTQMFIG